MRVKSNKAQEKPSHQAKRLKRSELFDRVVVILEQARNQVVRSVNSSMVAAYWLIGRELVLEIQGGKKRAQYGEKILNSLSIRLSKRYGSGFSIPNLQNFRKFYLAFPDRIRIQYEAGTKSVRFAKISTIQYPLSTESGEGFSPNLSWTHYRALMRVTDEAGRAFYEREASECGWSTEQLERQIHSYYYERLLAHRRKDSKRPPNKKRLSGVPVAADQVFKSPYVLEFLGLPDSKELHESEIEQAIIDNLQVFLLELGKGFCFVARQRHIRFDEEDFYVDLVFYNYILKCFVLVDLKIGKLTHRDVGQMDGYVRLFEDRFKVQGDNPTIGLILCSDKGEAVARYSVLSEGRQIFASRYTQFLPSEKELRLEITKERKLIEGARNRKGRA